METIRTTPTTRAMNLSPLLSAIRTLPAYAATLKAVQAADEAPLALGLMRSARPPVIAALAQDRAADGPTLLVAARRDRALALAEELAAWNSTLPILPFSEPNPLFYERAAWGPRTIRNRLAALARLATRSMPNHPPPPGDHPLIIASARALMVPTLPPREFIAASRTLTVGQTIRLEKLLQTWIGAGYEHGTVVVEPGTFSRRGGIIDVWPVAEPRPVRIELFGDEVETLRRFDPATQRSGETIQRVLVTPAREALPRFWRDEWAALLPEEATHPGAPLRAASLEFFIPLFYRTPASLLDYLPSGALVALDDWQEIREAISGFEEQAVQLRAERVSANLLPDAFPVPYHSLADFDDWFSARPTLHLGHFPETPGGFEDPGGLTPTPGLGAHFRPGPRYGGQLKPLVDHLRDLRARRARTVVVTRQARRLAEIWGEREGYSAPVDALPEHLPEGSLTFLQGSLTAGWTLTGAASDGGPFASPGRPSGPAAPSDLHLLTDGEIFGWARPEPRRRAYRTAVPTPESAYADLSAGDYVVHVDFGIGRFAGLVKRAIDAVEREYLKVLYAHEDEVYVPIHHADRLTRYVGAGDGRPALSRLGAQEWTQVKERTRRAVEDVAREMLELHAAREMAPGHAFSPDGAWQRELEAAFPYVETEDQLRAIGEVKRDMEKGRPMDRLICGDVGYGKTEVALRAAFKAVMDGKQAALLVPTTILAQQHLHTFQQRLAPFPVVVEMLSRFKTRARQDDILRRLESGQVDIVIGTHRLLQRDVHFKGLGLLIVDEEQRFGVTHKEFLKRMRTEVDVLTLTATPIPRTLYMSLTGVRDISTINTPPDERLPVITHVGPYSERLIRQAVLRELDRGGQVFYLHNRVRTIQTVRRRLETLLPPARIAVAHGQMNEKELARVMEEFTSGEIDLLVCTTIIESGLDIPNANTLIVERADAFGLAELYQLRGRVGRGAMRAYAYFFRDRRRRPTPGGLHRLETIAGHSELGAGYAIAMRDLEIRGAGDILGTRQHGHIVAVGFHLYTRLLARAVRRLRDSRSGPGEAPDGLMREGQVAPDADLEPVTVDLPIPTVLPTDYVPDRDLRLRLYRRLANVEDEAALQAISGEFVDRFGPLPGPVENLLFQLKLKLLAQRAGVDTVGVENGQPVVRLPPTSITDRAFLQANLDPGVRVSKNAIWFPRIREDEGWRERLERVLRKLTGITRLAPPAGNQ